MDESVPLQQPLRSISTTVAVNLAFRNATERAVDLLWANYAGELKKYKTLKAGETLCVNTYESHPWLFKDHVTQARLVVNASEVFMPKLLPALQLDETRNKRCVYSITIPIYSLKERAKQAVLHSLREQPSEQIQDLLLPDTLKRELFLQLQS